MSPGVLYGAQLPASLRAIDRVATLYHDAAKEVGCRVYGHPGGLTIKERYMLAEKREVALRQKREESIRQKEKQRELRGKLVRVEKHARKMHLSAADQSDRRGKGEGTHTVVASIKSEGILRSVSSRSKRKLEIRREINTHVQAARLVVGKMQHTFGMARARRELQADITRIRYPVPRIHETQKQGDQHQSARRQESIALRPPVNDREIMSPRMRYIRRLAATCLQRHVRGRAVRKMFKEMTWAIMHFRRAAEPPRYATCHMGRKAMLLAQFRLVLGAHGRLERACQGETEATHRAASDVAAARECRIVMWALRDAAARIIQEEIRHFARYRMKLRLAAQQQQKQQHQERLTTTVGRKNGERSHHYRGESEGGEIRSREDSVKESAKSGANRGTARPSCEASTSSSRDSKSRGEGGMCRGIGDQNTPVPDTGSGGVATEQERSLLSAAWHDSGSGSCDQGLVGDEQGHVCQHRDARFFDDDTVGSRPYNSPLRRVSGDMHVRGGTRGEKRWPISAGSDAGARGTAGPFLRQSEKQKKRHNEVSLRRNNSRRDRVQRSIAGLESQGTFVLPEIVKLQRLFRARRAGRMLDDGRGRTKEQDAEWQRQRQHEQDECIARWRIAISRLRRVPKGFSSGVLALSCPTTCDPVCGFDGAVGMAMRQGREDGIGDERWNFLGKDLPYASPKWGLAVAHDLESWHGGLRQRHHFSRLKAFLQHRKSRKASLRAKVEKRMVGRLTNWALKLSAAKLKLSCRVKARAPPDVFGAHLRFLSRAGRWEHLLRELGEMLQNYEVEREQAVEALKDRCPQFLTTANESSPVTLTRSNKREKLSSLHALQTRGNPPSPAERRERQRRPQHHPDSTGGKIQVGNYWSDTYRINVTGSGDEARGSMIGGSVPVVLHPRQLTRLKEVVGDQTLTALHPWLVAALASSDLQFVPSVPFERRVGHRVADAEKAEIYAEMQLTRRYWCFLDEVSRALHALANASREARALAAEAGEWALLLGFARHLFASGQLDPPATLPSVPRIRVAVPANTTTLSAALSRPRTDDESPSTPLSHEVSERNSKPYSKAGCSELGGAGATRGLRWFSPHKELCHGCFCLRGASDGPPRCPRCGLSRATLRTRAITGGGRGAAGPVRWQQFREIQEPLEAFVIHAAFACIIHPVRHVPGPHHGDVGSKTVSGGGGSSWWSGGTSDEAWWRAVCGGTRAAASLRDKGYSTVGQLFTISTSTAKVNSDETMMKCPEEEENVRRPCDGSRAAAVRRQLANGKTSRGDLVHQVVKDDDLAAKISSLFRMLMSAFEELRVDDGRAQLDGCARLLRGNCSQGHCERCAP